MTRAGRLLAPALAAVALAGAGHADAAATNPAARFVLSQHDVGGAYRLNANASGSRKLSDVTLGDSSAVQAQIRRNWLGGDETAYNGVSVPWGIVSLADVFRSTVPVATVLRAWQTDAVRISGGSRVPLPLGTGAPGTHGELVRGHIVDYEILTYIWSRGRTIASVDVTGKPGTVPVGLVLRLARAQDARIAAG
jgi:hypothetical protein